MKRGLGWSSFAALFALTLSIAVSGAHAQQFDPALYKEMRWRSIGPFRGGRSVAVAGVPSQPETYYFGATGGGVWKTTDGGTTWGPLFDKQPVASIGAIAVAPSDPNTIYVGTGEACIRGNISHGDGVYKSTDAGASWTNIGLGDTRHIGRIIVHPRNPDVVFVAALGHVYGTNRERGVFRSTDGGKTWDKVLYKDEKTGAIDISFAPSNPNTLYAALWEAFRAPWTMSSGGAGSGLYESSDGGATWKRLEGNGLPSGIYGRIGVSVSGADQNRVWALMEAKDGGLYRSDDGGANWRLMTDDPRFRQRAWYYTHVYADPQHAETVYVLNTGFYRSTDGGRTFTSYRTPHGDNHDLWINPNDPRRMINGNDGGANVSVNGGQTWTGQNNQPTAQFYHVITDNQFPYYVYGAQQDNSTVAIASRSDEGSITREDWYTVGGCESGYIAPHPKDPSIVYAGCYGGILTRFDKRTRQTQEIRAWPENPMGHAVSDLKYRWQWTAPIVISQHDPNTLYHAAQMLLKTTDNGNRWTAISPDLTRNDKAKQGPSGGPLTHDNTSVEYYNTIFVVTESPLEKGLIWVGTDDGLIHITRDSGKSWSNVIPRDLPEWSLISQIDASPHAAGAAYAAVDRHELDDFKPYIYKTSDYGKTWTRSNNGILEGAFVRAVREDPRRKGLLYAGTETGVYVSFDDGANWQSLQLNLPTTPIHDLVVKNDDLVVATHGRSFWILDDLTPLHEIADKVAQSEVHLFTPRPTYRFRGGGFGGGDATAGANPPGGAVIHYYLKSAAEGDLAMEILDGKGNSIRRFPPVGGDDDEAAEGRRGAARPRVLSKNAGMNRFLWDLRHEGASRVPRAISWGGSTNGPLAVPGMYQVKLTVAGKSYTAPLELKADPRISATANDLQKQFDLLLKIRDRVTEAHDTINEIRAARTQMQGLRRLLHQKEHQEILEAMSALEKSMTPIEEKLLQVKSRSSQDPLNFPVMLNDQLMGLGSVVDSADAAPTQQAYELYDDLAGQLNPLVAAWKRLKDGDLASLNERIQKAHIPRISISTSTGRPSSR